MCRAANIADFQSAKLIAGSENENGKRINTALADACRVSF